jgi:alpha-L-rhamnosidase
MKLRHVSLLILILLHVSFISMPRTPHGSDLKITGLQCAYANNPVGIDVQTPPLSWRLESDRRGTFQHACEIIVADSPEKLSDNLGNIWDSGILEASSSCGVKYAGPALKSRMRYYWKVKVWTDKDTDGTWSEPAFFEMGLLKPEDWQGDWISFNGGRTGRVLYFKGIFNIDKPVQSARTYISGIGYYELNINGKRAGDQQLDPAISDYGKRVYYSTYDVTPMLKKENVVLVSVGPGWYGIPKLRMQIEINFKDGTSAILSSPSMRSVTTGPVIRSSVYDGELYDAREENSEMYAYSLPDNFINKKWGYANITDAPGGIMVSQNMEPIKIMDTIVPADIREPLPGIYVIDAGRNLAGWAALHVKGKRGTEITLKFGEALYKDGTVNQENLRSAEARDVYILKGDENGESWEPRFTYHGFRYIQVEGFPYKPKPGDIQVRIVRSSVKQTGKFSCSNDLLNRIHNMVAATEASNLYSVPTDCPQRDERMGWLNDLTVRIEQALYNYDLSRFYPKFIDDVEDTQGPDGSITCTAPYRYGARPADPVCASYLLLALKSYEFYGNLDIIRQHYAGLKAWVDFLNSRTTNGIVNYSYYGDWSPPIEFGVDGSSPVSRFTPGQLMSTGYLLYCSRIIAHMAELTGLSADRIFYSALAEKTAAAFNATYWNEKAGGYGSNNQACNSFALFLGVVGKENTSRVVKNLVDDVKNHNYHLTTGNLCTKYLLEMLTENGYPEVAYKIATQETYPGWGYMLANGATTLWERWEFETGGAMNSHNHPMMGSVDSWFYKYILGILPDPEGPGFEKFSIHPVVLQDLDFASGELQTVRGLIKVAWKKDRKSFLMDVTVPCNSLATVYIPAKENNTITESNRRVSGVREIKFLYNQGQFAVYQVGSGTYHFRSTREGD